MIQLFTSYRIGTGGRELAIGQAGQLADTGRARKVNRCAIRFGTHQNIFTSRGLLDDTLRAVRDIGDIAFNIRDVGFNIADVTGISGYTAIQVSQSTTHRIQGNRGSGIRAVIQHIARRNQVTVGIHACTTGQYRGQVGGRSIQLITGNRLSTASGYTAVSNSSQFAGLSRNIGKVHLCTCAVFTNCNWRQVISLLNQTQTC